MYLKNNLFYKLEIFINELILSINVEQFFKGNTNKICIVESRLMINQRWAINSYRSK